MLTEQYSICSSSLMKRTTYSLFLSALHQTFGSILFCWGVKKCSQFCSLNFFTLLSEVKKYEIECLYIFSVLQFWKYLVKAHLQKKFHPASNVPTFFIGHCNVKSSFTIINCWIKCDKTQNYANNNFHLNNH